MVPIRPPRALLACAIAVFVSACSGGGGSSTSSPVIPLQPNPSPGATLTPVPAKAGSAPISLSVRLPIVGGQSIARGTRTLSPATQQVVIALTTVNGVAPAPAVSFSIDTSATSTACVSTGNFRTCSTVFSVPVGVDAFTATALDAGSNPLSNVAFTQTVYLNAANTIGVTLQSIVTKIGLALVTPAIATHANFTTPVVLAPTDPAGYFVLAPGTYAHPIVLTSSDTTGSIAFSLNGGATASSVNVTAPTDRVTLVYTDHPSFATATISAAMSGVSTSTTTFSAGAFAAVLVPGYRSAVSPGTLTLVAGPGQASVQFYGTAPFSAVSSCPAAASVSLAGAIATVTGHATASCTIVVGDAIGGSSTINVNVVAPLTADSDTYTYQSTLKAVAISGVGSSFVMTTSGGTGPYAFSASSNALAITGVTAQPNAAKITASASGDSVVSVTDALGETDTLAVHVIDRSFAANTTSSAPNQVALLDGQSLSVPSSYTTPPTITPQNSTGVNIAYGITGSTLTVNALYLPNTPNFGDVNLVFTDQDPLGVTPASYIAVPTTLRVHVVHPSIANATPSQLTISPGKIEMPPSDTMTINMLGSPAFSVVHPNLSFANVSLAPCNPLPTPNCNAAITVHTLGIVGTESILITEPGSGGIFNLTIGTYATQIPLQ